MYIHAGINTNGELGIKNNTNMAGFEKAKTESADLTQIISIGRRSGDTANAVNSVIHENGRVFCTGSNENGALGDGTKNSTNYFKEMMYQEANYKEKIKIKVGETINLTEEEFKIKQNYLNVYKDEIENIPLLDKTRILDDEIAGYANGEISGKKIGKTLLHTVAEKIVIYTPVEVLPEGAEFVPTVEAGEEFNIALRANGEIWSFGKNENGELGLGENENKNFPVKIEDIQKVNEISVGTSHTIAMTEERNIYTWGKNKEGQLRKWKYKK